MAASPAALRGRLTADLLALHSEVAQGVSPKRLQAGQVAWRIWLTFCQSLGIDPGLSEFDDPVWVLMLFGKQWRDGTIAPRGKQVRGRTAEDAVRLVGQAFTELGARDPRLGYDNKVDFRIKRQHAGWRKSDPPAQRREIVPRAVLLTLTTTAKIGNAPHLRPATDLMWLGLHFLLRPAEFLFTQYNTYTTAFTLADVSFWVAGQSVPSTSLPTSAQPTKVGLLFTEQKNGISGDRIWLQSGDDPDTCPVACCLQRCRQLLERGCGPSTPFLLISPAQTAATSLLER